MAFTTSPMRNAGACRQRRAQSAARQSLLKRRLSIRRRAEPNARCGAASASGRGRRRETASRTACRGGTCCCAACKSSLAPSAPLPSRGAASSRDCTVWGPERTMCWVHGITKYSSSKARSSGMRRRTKRVMRLPRRKSKRLPGTPRSRSSSARCPSERCWRARRARAGTWSAPPSSGGRKPKSALLGLLSASSRLVRRQKSRAFCSQPCWCSSMPCVTSWWSRKPAAFWARASERASTTRARRKSRDFASRAERGREAARSASSSKSRARWRRRGRRRRRRGRRRWQGRPAVRSRRARGSSPVRRPAGAAPQRRAGSRRGLPASRGTRGRRRARPALRACGSEAELGRVRRAAASSRPHAQVLASGAAVQERDAYRLARALLAATALAAVRRRVEEAHEVVRRTLEVGRREHGHRGGARRQRVVGGGVPLCASSSSHSSLSVKRAKSSSRSSTRRPVARDKGVLVELCLQGDGFETRHRRIDARGRGEPAGEPAPQVGDGSGAVLRRHRRGRPLRQQYARRAFPARWPRRPRTRRAEAAAHEGRFECRRPAGRRPLSMTWQRHLRRGCRRRQGHRLGPQSRGSTARQRPADRPAGPVALAASSSRRRARPRRGRGRAAFCRGHRSCPPNRSWRGGGPALAAFRARARRKLGRTCPERRARARARARAAARV